jgi:hypothetical protein
MRVSHFCRTIGYRSVETTRGGWTHDTSSDDDWSNAAFRMLRWGRGCGNRLWQLLRHRSVSLWWRVWLLECLRHPALAIVISDPTTDTRNCDLIIKQNGDACHRLSAHLDTKVLGVVSTSLCPFPTRPIPEHLFQLDAFMPQSNIILRLTASEGGRGLA